MGLISRVSSRTYRPAMATFICNTCNFFTTDAQSLKIHYLSEWHRYNLKRKTAELPPVTKENFDKRVALTKHKELQASVKNHFKCPYSGKVFKSEGAWNTFKKSKKFRELEAKNRELNTEAGTYDGPI